MLHATPPSNKPTLVLLVAEPGAQRDEVAKGLARDGHVVVRATPSGAESFLAAVRSEPASVAPPDRVIVIGVDAEDVAARLIAIWPMPCLLMPSVGVP